MRTVCTEWKPEVKVRWITPFLGTSSASADLSEQDLTVIDVRDLVDKAGNGIDAILGKIKLGVKGLEKKERVVVCCDYGISRSNAIATGILSQACGITFDEALHRVQDSTEEMQMQLAFLNEVRRAIGAESNTAAHTRFSSVLITGSHGFLGSALLGSIKNMFEVVTPSRSELDIEAGNTRLDQLAIAHDIDCIVHFANPRVYTSNAALGQSLTMLRNVIEVCLERNATLVYPSSWEVYSGYAGSLLADEATPLLPRGSYGESKYLSELLIEHFRRSAGLRCALLRISPVYGCGSSRPKFIYTFIEKARLSLPITTHRYRNGSPALDLLHVSDLVSAFVSVLNLSYSGTLNIGTGVLTTTLRIAEILKGILGSESSVEQVQLETDVACIAMNCLRAEKELGWRPVLTLESGLRSILAGSTTGGAHLEH